MDERIRLLCPVCGAELRDDNSRLFCTKKGHSFDKARQGYINLLPVQNKHSLNPGDTKEMLAARRSFLDKGCYSPICMAAAEAIKRYSPSGSPVIADIGCGEGYYTSFFKAFCGAACIGIDISKEGARMACSRDRDILWLVATASHLPLADGCADVVSAIFSLFMPEEYARILKKGGCAVEITAGTEHLIELKSIIYDEVFEQHKHPSPCGELFYEAECREHKFSLTLDNPELRELLLMTPHFWRIKKERREQLEQTDKLTLTVHYWVRALIKK